MSVNFLVVIATLVQLHKDKKTFASYPATMLLLTTGGIMPSWFSTNARVVIIGEYIVSTSGMLNCAIFFFLEPTMASMSRKVVFPIGELRRQNGDRGTRFLQLAEAVFGFLGSTKVKTEVASVSTTRTSERMTQLKEADGCEKEGRAPVPTSATSNIKPGSVVQTSVVGETGGSQTA
ncbi:hypothetical protein M427DRAFT_30645 [Gonapodya prolifera JEL478]|uniref:Uncharacterized protein n=1 Tax=Gonapodya prolifera (strain JEL478) TaxID=1344416 RepID=A0A139AL15_GONPJ|nr:hypothetical protein M427DRAFT_30645 [Gonapodya prolifera JEL478]|eukprot:KXS17183.1 hypothetical protein M427DRAFT_30645 [Gonapodya prolifera JEL478]